MIDVTCVSWGHEHGYSLHIGRWNDPDHGHLHAFDSLWDAWAFAIANGLPDPMATIPAKNRRWTNRPPVVDDSPVQTTFAEVES